ncbi:spore maturation protein CgeB [Trichlorobacter thiogenes]|uniref:Spore maturation protein CgeB n=1 Tax=Trichlorobacter thiogenes TaxID=115783 RepID=A0A1T4MLQ7_9BACT|nr:glycosyltransferase [Trichlorobacter thiogenes]SJZ68030.1 spore maturation protein CgeB [Trichlorobacter thiogenes]
MKIGFYIQWPKNSMNSKGNVLGDELIGESLVRAFRRLPEIDWCELYAPNHLPDRALDIMIYMNENEPVKEWARRHVLYMQNAYGDGSDAVLRKFQSRKYDGYAFISKRLLQLHLAEGYGGIFLPFGVDVETFRPVPKEACYAFDVAYVGSDIKGEERTVRYLVPATGYNFGLFGNWVIPRSRFRIWKNWGKRPNYQKTFEKLSRGKIPQADVPILYSSTQINLNCTAQDCVDWDVITLRTLEVLACKGFLITDRVSAAERELDGCVVFTDGDDDLVKKIRYYLDHPQERDAIALKGYQYVIQHATIERRAEKFLAYLKGIA